MKIRTIAYLLLVIILSQSCVIYQKSPVSHESEYKRGKAKVHRYNRNNEIEIKFIIEGDSIYYKRRYPPRNIVPFDPSQFESVYLIDKAKSTIGTIAVVVGIVAIPFVVLYGLLLLNGGFF